MKSMSWIGWMVLGAVTAMAGELNVGYGGRLTLTDPGCAFAPHLFLPGWQGRDPVGGYAPNADGSRSFTIRPGSDHDPKLNGRVTCRALDGGQVEVAYAITPEAETAIQCLSIAGSFPVTLLGGGTAVCDGKEAVRFPVSYTKGKIHLYAGTVSEMALKDGTGKLLLTLRFPQPTALMFQDNREWNGADFSLRIYLEQEHSLQAKRAYAMRMTVGTAEPLTLVGLEPKRITAGKEWIPLAVDPEIEEGSALDFSKISGIDAPAGKYGYVVAKGQQFEFEKKPGVPQRFYGVNICASANYLTPKTAKAFARRLAKTGYNALRLHHHDAGLTEGMKDGTTLNPDRLEQLDFLIAACVENGIYLTTDLFVSRRIPYRAIGIDQDGNVEMDEFKALVPIHEGAYQNFIRFSRQFLEHVNPFTKRRYADEPALSWLALVNEGNPGNQSGHYYQKHEVWRNAWTSWLAERKKAEPAAYGAIPETIPGNLWNRDAHAAAFSLFLQEKETAFANRVRAFIRDEMRCKALLTNMSCWMNPVCYQLPRAACYDYVDDHFYVDHPSFLEQSWRLPSRCANVNPMLGNHMGAQGVVFRRLLDKPFTITEYNYSGPGRFRGVGGIATGTAAALQNWGGVWRFAWSHSDWAIVHSGEANMGYVDMSGDPLSLAAERASICLFLRGDLPPLAKTYAMVLPEKKLKTMDGHSPLNGTDWPWVSWYARLGTVVADAAPADATWSGSYPEVYRKSGDEIRREILPDAPTGPMPKAGDGAVVIDPKSGTFLLTTPRTCGGFAEKGIISAGPLTVDLRGTAATVWVSSLDKYPLDNAEHLLLTHLTDVQNSGITYADSALTVLTDWGNTPHLFKNGEARVTLKLDPESTYKVFCLSTGGKRRREVPSVFEDGILMFTADVDADPQNASFLYEIERQ
ncbi:MAG: cellulase family glycosylhydrolase [Kiritimatiellae bacterium]|nr:cellulase family glycosylhydrolase [Kiritimatiellia bacterium]